MNSSAAALLALSLTLWTVGAHADVRARDLGIPLHGEPGALNAITDVAGVEVGHKTLIEGTGELRVGTGPVRTGVTVVLPRGRSSTTPVFAGWSTLNAAGEMTGTAWLDERGLIDGPIAITNTHSVGVVRDAVIGWMVKRGWTAEWHAPVIAETYDGVLNDINGFHVRSEHVNEALEAARGGPVQEGSVGGGTGMICHRFKGGIGTSSRLAKHGGQQYVVGALVQCNYGDRRSMRIAGLPVGEELKDKYLPQQPRKDGARDGSIIVVLATDAPLLPHQLKRLSKRASLALGRMGSVASARLRRHLRRILDREPRTAERRARGSAGAAVPQRGSHRAVRSCGGRNRGSDPQCAGRGSRYDRRRRHEDLRAPARGGARHDESQTEGQMKMKSTMLPLMLLSAILPVGAAMAQLAPPVECRSGGSTYEVVDPLFDAFMKKDHVPGVVYGVVHRGRLVHCRAVGVRDVASGEPVTFDTVFRIASMTKSFTALAVLKLRDANKSCSMRLPRNGCRRSRALTTRPRTHGTFACATCSHILQAS